MLVVAVVRVAAHVVSCLARIRVPGTRREWGWRDRRAGDAGGQLGGGAAV